MSNIPRQILIELLIVHFLEPNRAKNRFLPQIVEKIQISGGIARHNLSRDVIFYREKCIFDLKIDFSGLLNDLYYPRYIDIFLLRYFIISHWKFHRYEPFQP